MYTNFFTQFPEIIAQTSIKGDGDMRSVSVRNQYLVNNGINPDSLVLARQIHSNTVLTVTRNTKQGMEADGLLTQEPGVFIGVLTADCVPIFFYESNKQIYGIVHAGWKGTLEGIAGRMTQQIMKLGGSLKHLYVVLGPYIGACCYRVTEDRAELFRQRFGTSEQLAYRNDNAWHLDLGFANRNQLLEFGVKQENIEAPIFCTSCQHDTFFSFRRNSKQWFGEMLSVIGCRGIV